VAPSVFPGWLPASGAMGRVNLNQLVNVADSTNSDSFLTDTDLANTLNTYGSTVFCKDYGPLGSILIFGGGHNDRINNAVYRYDIYTRLFSRISNGTPIPIRSLSFDAVSGSEPVGAIANPWAEYWTDNSRTAVITGKCGPPHTYGNLQYVPASAAGNTNGFLVLMGGWSFGAHMVDLDNPSAGWGRCGALFTDALPSTQISGYGSTLWDSSRSKLVCYPFNGSAQSNTVTLSFPAKTVGTTVAYMNSYYSVSRYMAADDLYVCMNLYDAGNPPIFYVHDPVTGTITTAAQSGTLPTARFYTLEWDEQHRRVVGWDGASTTLWVCTPPSNPRTGSWVWSSLSFTNSDPVVQQTGANLMYDRLHYVPGLQAFFAVVRVDGPVQCWKL
jgi:hypothetical protein